MRRTRGIRPESVLGVVAVGTIALVASTATAQAPDLFRTTPTFDVGDGPTAIVSCDLNEDCFPDVVTADKTFNDVAVLLSDGKGGFRPQVRFGVGRSPRGLACADIDGDENLDVVTVNYDDRTISILRGNGDGTFRVGAVTISVQDYPESLAVGLFDEGDKLDIAVGSSSRIKIFLGTGEFNFREAPELVLGGTALGIAQLDEDENADLMAVQSGSDTVQVFWGNGDGTFTTIGNPMPVGTFPSSVAANDVDEDTIMDVLVSNSSTNDISLLKGLGARQFAPAVSIAVGSQPAQVFVRDINDDRHLDIVTCNDGSNDVSVRLGYGDGTFDPEIRFGAGNNPNGLTIDQFDDDENFDVATANFSSNDVSLLLGNGDGIFRWEPRFGVGDEPRSVVACDFNNDLVPDLASVNYKSNDVSVLIGMGEGSYETEVWYPVAEGPVAIRCADMKEDGAIDLVIADSLSSEVSALIGVGDGTFESEPRFSVGPAQDLAICDLDEDQHLDVVTANGGNVSLLFGDGTGFFWPEVRLPFPGLHVACVDLNDDLHDDLVLTSSSTIYVRLGNGDGSFEDRISISSGLSTLTGLAVARLNGNNSPDLAVVSANSDRWQPFRGKGNGTFSPLNTYDTGDEPRFIIATDVDFDRNTDIIVTNKSDDDLSVFLGNGDGSFESQRRFGVGEDPRGITAGDVDNDGDDDLVVANSTSDSLSVLFNTVFEMQCDRIKRLKTKCKGAPGAFKVKATVKSKLPENMHVTLILDDTDRRIAEINQRGKAKATWKKVDPGSHEVCSTACPDICAGVNCR